MSKSISSIKPINKLDTIKDVILDYNPIYKVNYLVDESINTIFVFYGKHVKTANQEELFKKIFTDSEIDKIHSEKISIQFSDQQIHYDDTIGTIKIKILKEIQKRTSLDEIYLFCQKQETVNSVQLYKSLTQNKKLELTKVRLDQFLSNIVTKDDTQFQSPPLKDIYTFDDILEMKLENKMFTVDKVLGEKFFIVENEYPFVCNPYNVTKYDTFFEKTARKSLSTLNSHLLLSSGEIVNNNIYLCLARDVLKFASDKDISSETTVKIYFPFLYNKNIDSLEDLESSQEKLIENNKKVINEKTSDSFKTIDMFYDVYKLRKSELKYVNKGIKFIKAVIRPEFDIKIPLEVIFKIIHATENNPLIKYNPSTRQENVYRLYTADKIATDGRKIPVLKKAVIFKLMKSIARTKSVSVYIENNHPEYNTQSLICEFDETGYVTVTSEFDKAINETVVSNLFRDSINPIIIEIKKILEQSGYKLNLFNNLNDSNVEIKQLTYESTIEILKPLKLENFTGCISSIFINESIKHSEEIKLRFKRVSNFSKVTSQEAFILEKSAQKYRGHEIIDALLENFPDDLDRKQAEDLVRKVANEIQLERGVRKSDIKIKNNPGFKTTILLEKNTGIITISVENINDINYLATIPVYLDSIVRITQDKNSTTYPTQEINRLCSSGEKEEILVPDIISSDESSASKREVPSLEPDDEYVEYKKYTTIQAEKPKGALSLFFDDEDGDEDEETVDKYSGGELDESSGSSVPSDKSEEITYNGVPVPSGLSSDNSESSVESEKVLSPIPDVPSPEPSVESAQVLSPIPSVAPSEPSVESEKVLSPIPSIAPSEPSVESEKVLSPIPSIKESPPSVPSEPSVESEKVLSPIPSIKESLPSVESEKVLSPIPSIKESEPSVESEKVLSPIPSIKETQSELVLDKEIAANKTEVEVDEATVAADEEDESEDDEEEEEEPMNEKKHLDSQDNIVKNIDGMKLNKPYYFQTLIEKKDPVLILKEDTPEFNAYSRTCRSDMRRQPVIITDSQLENINKEHAGFLREEDVIKYGSNPKNKFNYICPRYWCLKNNTVIDPKDLKEVTGKNGKKELIHPTCGKVLPRDEKQVKPGYYIYEFYNEKDNKRYPGFQTDKHPQGYCLPCCFDKYNTLGRISAKKKCYGEEKQDNKTEEKQEEYIKGPDKFPLSSGRWGYLPVEIQTMLHVSNADCQISKTNTNVKQNFPCLLRHGVEVNNKQSFIACISDILFFGKKSVNVEDKTSTNTTKVFTIKEMREIIIKALTLDTFIKYQNGNLVTNFYDATKKSIIDKYTNTKTFSRLNMEKQEDKFYFTKVVSAFENFISFLKDDDAIIDHTYLWDIISMPNKYLFPIGVNLIIFQIPNNDITNNVQLLCPTNHYSSEFYQARKPTVFLIKEDGYYEPIYSYTNNNKKFTVLKEFKEYDPQLSKTMRAIFKEIIKPFFTLICTPLDSMPTVYKSKRPLLLYDLVKKLDKYEYKLLKMVLNFNNKVIGVISEEPGVSTKRCFVPCYPSSLDEDLKQDIDVVFMTDSELWNTYSNTVNFLNKLDKRTKKRRDAADIPCKPMFKILEDELVVGILTETNQFIQLSQPVPESEIAANIDIPSINNDNYIVNSKERPMVSIDVPVSTTDDVDKERVDYIKKIKLETSFYNVFRSTIRILLNDYENIQVREKVENEMGKEYIIYSEKLENINILLRELVKTKIQFIGDENYYKLINEVSTCVVKNKDECSNTPNLCVVTENGVCNLILPEKNLITNKTNEPMYFGRMSDELIRYSRIKSFMLEPQIYLSFGNVSYNLRENEIIMIQSLLTQEYFETLIPTVLNKYVKNNSYDETEPIITQIYENAIPSLDHAIGRKNEKECTKKIKDKITSSLWKGCFPENYNMIEYTKQNFCTFNFIIDLIERKTGTKLSVNKIKNDLFAEYKPYLEKYTDKIIDILIIEGKKTLGDQVKAETLSFSSFLYTDNYFLTTFDLWLLVQKYKIPTIFICQKFILQTKYEKHAFVGYGNRNDTFAFVLIPGFRPETVPVFRLVQSEKGDAFISLNKLDNSCVDKIYEAFDNEISVDEYLEGFKKIVKTTYNKKKPMGLIIETDSDSEKHVTTKKREIIIEDNSPTTPEKVVKPKKTQTKKQGKVSGKPKTKKNVKTSLIIESSS